MVEVRREQNPREERRRRLSWLRQYKEKTKAEKEQLIKVAMVRFGVSRKTALDYIFIL